MRAIKFEHNICSKGIQLITAIDGKLERLVNHTTIFD